MSCAEKLLKNGNSPNGNQLLAKFDKNTRPAMVKVLVNGVDQNDVSEVNAGGVWTSKNKYTTTTVSLVLLDANGGVIQTCSYNDQGTPVADKKAIINSFKAVCQGGESELSWNIVEEVNVQAYVVDRFYRNAFDTRSIFFNPTQAVGPYKGMDNNLIEDIVNLDLYDYRIFASFKDNSLSQELARATVAELVS